MQNQTEALEVSVEQAKDAINTRNELIRLQNENPTFKRLFMEGYIEQYGASLIKQLGYPGNETDERQNIITISLRSIGEFNAYMERIIQVGDQMERDLGSFQAELEESRSEEADL